MVAVSDYSTYPPEATKKPSIGSLIKPSIETILSFHPDLAIGINIPGSEETASQLQAVFLVTINRYTNRISTAPRIDMMNPADCPSRYQPTKRPR